MVDNDLLRYARWWPWVLVAATLHVAGIAYVFWHPTATPVVPKDDAPIAITLAPEQQSVAAPPVDLALNQVNTQQAVQSEAALTPPPVTQPQPDISVPETEKGTIAKKEDVPEKKQPEKKELKPIEKKPRKPVEKPKKKEQLSAQASQVPTVQQKTTSAKSTAAPVAGSSSNSVNQLADWRSQVVLKLQKVKRYPDSARVMQEEDTITVSFTILPDGKTSNIKIVKSQGFQDLEDEVTDMLVRASPMPPPPDGKEITLLVPIAFALE